MLTELMKNLPSGVSYKQMLHYLQLPLNGMCYLNERVKKKVDILEIWITLKLVSANTHVNMVFFKTNVAILLQSAQYMCLLIHGT